MPYTLSSTALVTLDQAKIKCAIKPPDSSKDDQLVELINSASRTITGYCEREFTPTASATRRFKVDRSLVVDLLPYDLRSATAVTLNPEASPVTLATPADYMLEPIPSVFGTYQQIHLSQLLAVASTTLFRFGYALIDVTGAWGFATVPADVERACLVTVDAWYRSEETVTGSQFPTSGETVFPQTVDSLPLAAIRLVRPFKRMA